MPLHLTPQVPFPPTVSAGFIGKPASFSQALSLFAGYQNFTTVVKLDQAHGTNCLTVTRPEQLHNIENTPADACITTLPSVLLSVRVADCTPLLFAGTVITDTQNPQAFVGVAHGGRKGAQAGIMTHVFQKIESIGALTELALWLGPMICAKCYEINPTTHETYDLLAKHQQDIAVYQKNNHTVNIQMNDSGHCTLHEPEQFHSYRRTGADTPMNFGFIGMQSKN